LFCPDFSPWQETTARTSHEDLFGRDIKTGEIYYNRNAGAAYDDIIKISRLSMARLVYVFSYCNFANLDLEFFDDVLRRN